MHNVGLSNSLARLVKAAHVHAAFRQISFRQISFRQISALTARRRRIQPT